MLSSVGLGGTTNGHEAVPLGEIGAASIAAPIGSTSSWMPSTGALAGCVFRTRIAALFGNIALPSRFVVVPSWAGAEMPSTGTTAPVPGVPTP